MAAEPPPNSRRKLPSKAAESLRKASRKRPVMMPSISAMTLFKLALASTMSSRWPVRKA